MRSLPSNSLERSLATEIVSGYEAFRLRWKITQQDMRILREVQLTGNYYRKDGCPKCRELYDRLCGVGKE